MNQERKTNSDIGGGGGRMHKRRRSEGHDDDQRSTLKSQKHKHKHLYLVLDDWDDGYTIRKIDADSPDDLVLSSEPPVIRLLSPGHSHAMTFAAMGSSHILASSNQHPATLVYDTASAGLTTGPPVPAALQDGCTVFLPAGAADGDKLYAFAYYFMRRPQAVEVLSSAAAKGLRPSVPTVDWAWRSVAPSLFSRDERLYSCAAHPDGRTVFVSSLTVTGINDRRFRTLSFDAGREEWTLHGEWGLPFMGKGCYDGHLDAWVGLDEDGYIGACQVASPAAASSSSAIAMEMQPPELKVAGDKLWSKERRAAQRPTLTCMGRGRFCLVDCVVREGMKSSYTDGCTLSITTFRLRYSHKGELQIHDLIIKSCPMTKNLRWFSPVAFWM